MTTKLKRLTNKTAQQLSDKNLKARRTLLRRKSDLPWGNSGTALLVPNFKTDDQKLFRRKTDLDKCGDLSDGDLIDVIHTQNKEAYKELFLRYQKKLFTYIFHLVGNRDETEDILQNVFSKTYKNIEHFDTSRKFSSWIYRIAHNEAVNFLKRKSKRYTVSWDDIATSKDKLDTATNDELPEDKWAHEEIKKEIDEALDRLPQKYQQVLKLRYYKEYAYEDIGNILKKPVNTVGTLINRAKKKLFEVVQKQGAGK